MSDRTVIGIQPWLPRPLNRMAWWTEPVRAERLAALRIGIALVLLLDILETYLPHVHDFFGPNSLGSSDVFAARVQSPYAYWSVLRWFHVDWVVPAALTLWVWSAIGLLLGCGSRFWAAVAWMMSLSIMNLDYYLHNGGDRIRTILLFYLMLCPCGAAWSVTSLWRRRRLETNVTVFVTPWALRLIFLQMVAIYFMNGVYKLFGTGWQAGDSLYYVMHDISWSRWPADWTPVPFVVTKALTWLVLGWELAFPLLVFIPSTRKAALWLGVLFHVGTGVSMQLGPFALYALCLYLPLVPWESWCGVAGDWLRSFLATKREACATGTGTGTAQHNLTSETDDLENKKPALV